MFRLLAVAQPSKSRIRPCQFRGKSTKAKGKLASAKSKQKSRNLPPSGGEAPQSLSQSNTFDTNQQLQEHLVDYFGLGQKDPSSEWRDKKLESRVAGLFQQTLDLVKVPGTPLHPLDLEALQEMDAAKERLAVRLYEIREYNPGNPELAGNSF